MTDQPRWPTPVTESADLYWYFVEAESAMGIRSAFEQINAMAVSGVTGHGAAQTDDRLVQRGVVGVRTDEHYKPAPRWHDGTTHAPDPGKRDRESTVGKYRRIHGYVRPLPQIAYCTLMMAYGWQRCVGQVREMLSDAQRGKALRDKLGHHAGVAFLTDKGRSMSPLKFEAWVHSKKTPIAELTQVKLDALDLLREAYGRYASNRGYVKARPVFARYSSDDEAQAALDERERLAGR